MPTSIKAHVPAFLSMLLSSLVGYELRAQVEPPPAIVCQCCIQTFVHPNNLHIFDHTRSCKNDEGPSFQKSALFGKPIAPPISRETEDGGGLAELPLFGATSNSLVRAIQGVLGGLGEENPCTAAGGYCLRELYSNVYPADSLEAWGDQPAFHTSWLKKFCVAHRVCLEPEEVQQAIVALASANYDSLIAFEASNPTAVHINLQRGLLQLMDCNGSVRSQLAISVDAVQAARVRLLRSRWLLSKLSD
jgi:hypothetical protein